MSEVNQTTAVTSMSMIQSQASSADLPAPSVSQPGPQNTETDVEVNNSTSTPVLTNSSTESAGELSRDTRTCTESARDLYDDNRTFDETAGEPEDNRTLAQSTNEEQAVESACELSEDAQTFKSAGELSEDEQTFADSTGFPEDVGAVVVKSLAKSLTNCLKNDDSLSVRTAILAKSCPACENGPELVSFASLLSHTLDNHVQVLEEKFSKSFVCCGCSKVFERPHVAALHFVVCFSKN